MRRVVLFSLALTLVVVACSDQMTPAQPDTEPQLAMVPVSVAAAPAISTLTITVSASDIPSDLVFNVTMTNGEATDTITVPAGSGRTITVRGYDASNIETHRGSKTVNLTEGVNPQLTVVLEGLTGDQPLVVALGETTVAVSPETATVSVGGTTQLAAVVTDEAGDTLAVNVRWASSHPAVATVDDAGLVSGVSTGTASIIATYGGVGASAAVTVSDAVFPTEGLVAWYPFNGNANDESGNSLDLTTFGSPTLTSDRHGTANAAYDFNGTTDYFYRARSDLLLVGPSFTLNAWIWSGAPDGNADVILGTLDNPDLGGYQLTIGNEGPSAPIMQFDLREGATAYDFSHPLDGPEFGRWLMVTGVFTPAQQTIYVDGVSVAVQDTPASVDYSGSNNFRIGGNGHATDANRLFKGIIDDVGIWNRVLTAEEIAYLANN